MLYERSGAPQKVKHRVTPETLDATTVGSQGEKEDPAKETLSQTVGAVGSPAS